MQLDLYGGRQNPARQLAAPASLVDRQVEADPGVQKQRLEIRDLESKFNKISELYQANASSRRLKALQGDLELARKELDRIRKDRRTEAEQVVRKQLEEENQAKTADNQAAIKRLSEDEKGLQQKTEDSAQKAEQLGVSSVELDMRRTEIDQHEAAIRSLREARNKLEIELQVQKNRMRVTLYQNAEPPSFADVLKQMKYVGAAGGGFFLLGLFGICLWEMRSCKISDRDEVMQTLGMRVIGSLPFLRSKKSTSRFGQAVREKSNHLLRDSIDSIRTMLLCDQTPSARQVFMITSACSREGKTTLASHLAGSLIRMAQRTLLIDADMRRPLLHQLFEVSLEPGLSEVLLGEVEAADAITRIGDSTLSILPAGRKAGLALTCLAQGGMRQLLERLRPHYDFIIIDSCPVVSVPDALLIGRCVDGVLLSVRPHQSRMPTVHAASQRLLSLNIPVIGAVVNGEAISSYNYSYSYPYQTVTED
jgi:capsular exopolysaccharide synthesis family protein